MATMTATTTTRQGPKGQGYQETLDSASERAVLGKAVKKLEGNLARMDRHVSTGHDRQDSSRAIALGRPPGLPMPDPRCGRADFENSADGQRVHAGVGQAFELIREALKLRGDPWLD